MVCRHQQKNEQAKKENKEELQANREMKKQ